MVFQAEDGIRDKLVTGVQTCALPISGRGSGSGGQVAVGGGAGTATGGSATGGGGLAGTANGGRPDGGQRSEERRVGKECSTRGPPYEEKKKVLDNVQTAALCGGTLSD